MYTHIYIYIYILEWTCRYPATVVVVPISADTVSCGIDKVFLKVVSIVLFPTGLDDVIGLF